jgi:hypothetical protein
MSVDTVLEPPVDEELTDVETDAPEDSDEEWDTAIPTVADDVDVQAQKDATDTKLVQVQVLEPLTPEEQERRKHLLVEAKKYEKATDKFFDILVTIHNEKLYRDYGTMAMFTEAYFPNLSKRHVYNLIAHEEVKQIAAKAGIDAPKSEKSTRPLSALAEESDKAEALQAAQVRAKAANVPVTEKLVKEEVDKKLSGGAKRHAKSRGGGGGGKREKDTGKPKARQSTRLLEYGFSAPDGIKFLCPEVGKYQVITLIDLLKGVPPNVIKATIRELGALGILNLRPTTPTE